jgi:hypothetical protein
MLDIGTTVILDGMHKGHVVARSLDGYTIALEYGETLGHWDGESVSALTGEPLLAAVECV